MTDPTSPPQQILPEHDLLLREYARSSSSHAHYLHRYQTARAKLSAGRPWREIIDDDPGFEYHDWLCSNYTRSSGAVWEDVTQQYDHDRVPAGTMMVEDSPSLPYRSTMISEPETQHALQRRDTSGDLEMLDMDMDSAPPAPTIPTQSAVPGHQGRLSWDVWNSSSQRPPSHDPRASTMLTPQGEGLADLRRALPDGTVKDPEPWGGGGEELRGGRGS